MINIRYNIYYNFWRVNDDGWKRIKDNMNDFTKTNNRNITENYEKNN